MGHWANMGNKTHASSVIRQKGERTCAYQRVRNIRFSENLACFVFLKHPFSDSPISLITDCTWNGYETHKRHTYNKIHKSTIKYINEIYSELKLEVLNDIVQHIQCGNLVRTDSHLDLFLKFSHCPWRFG